MPRAMRTRVEDAREWPDELRRLDRAERRVLQEAIEYGAGLILAGLEGPPKSDDGRNTLEAGNLLAAAAVTS